MATPLTGEDVAREGLDDWRYLLGALHTRLEAPYATLLALVADIGAAAEAADHHPDLDLRYAHLDVRLFSHDVFGVSRRDLRMARRISELAGQHGVTARPRACQVLEIGYDTARADELAPFWRAVLGLDDHPHEEGNLVDRAGRLPTVWFQESEHREQRDRAHLDITVPHDVAEQRVEAALAAGGRLVDESHAPSWWVLADPDGNLVCVCTWQGRATD